MKFPVIIIKEKESPICFFDKEEFGLISKGGEAFYKNSTIYDSEGNVFLVKGVENIRKAPVLKSIRYFQSMFLLTLKTEIKEKISIEKLKQIVSEHISQHSKYWEKKDTIESIKAEILSKNQFDQIIKSLK